MTVSHSLTFKSALLAATMLASPLVALAPGPAGAQVAIELSVRVAPPLLPIYAQPPLPVAGYIWTPGYWHWSQRVGYYWVPGTWLLPPTVGMLWTPPYWGWAGGVYVFHAGYWGPQVGYYGGVNYGYGYSGVGYQGGRWDSGDFVYNRTVNNFGAVHVAHTYQQKVTAGSAARVSFTGGTHGLKSAPSTQERAAEQDQHVPVTAQQSQHIAAAVKVPALAASRNGGRPAIAATSHPAQFKGPGVVRAQPATVQHAAAPHPVAAAPARAAAPHLAHAPAGEKGKENKPD